MDTKESVPGERMNLTRRDFLKGVGVGGGALVLFGPFGVPPAGRRDGVVPAASWAPRT